MTTGDISYDVLWQTYQKERQSNELQLVPKNFYDSFKEFINSHATGAEDEKSQKENAAKLLTGIFEKRRQKMLIYAAYGRQLPSPAPQQDVEFYEQAIKLLKSNALDYSKEKPKAQTLRSMQSIPQIILPSGRKIGPLDKEQLIEIEDKEDTTFLINNGICKQA